MIRRAFLLVVAATVPVAGQSPSAPLVRPVTAAAADSAEPSKGLSVGPPVGPSVGPAGGALLIRRAPRSIAGDGRVKAPADIEVGYAPLKPMQVSTVVLHPGVASVLRFPYLVKKPVWPDDGTFLIQNDANTVFITPKECLQGCKTNLFVMLDDGNYTPVPFLLVVDTTRTVTMLVDYTDPVSAQMRQREAELAAQYEEKAAATVAERLEPEVERCLATGFTFRPVGKANAWRDPNTGESIGVSIADVGFSGQCLARPKLYIRYAIHNVRYTPTQAVRWTIVKQDARTRRATAVVLLEDRRDPQVVPAMRQVRGELVVDGTMFLAAGESLLVRAEIDGHEIDVGAVLSAPADKKER